MRYRRLIRTMEVREVGYPKAYLFATARNAALDLFRKKRMILALKNYLIWSGCPS